MKIVKNWLEKDLAFRVRNFLLDQQYKYTESSLTGTGPSFFSSHFDINQNKDIMTLFPLLVSQFEYDIEIIKVYANLQFYGMNGDWHTDDGDITCLWMATKSLPKGSGEFKTKKQSVKFDFNKLVMFDAKKLHKGMAPKELNTPRITLAFKTRKYT
tara:strand:- start:3033 stop:3500 length:468 start_codon:yes stop_codon:yes gene_type:complete